MAYTASDLAAIRSAIARGELIVEIADRKVTYRGIAELLQAEAHIATALNTTPRAKQSYGVSSKGF